jgi:cytochrome c-type biogenesis protein CcmH/NrfG
MGTSGGCDRERMEKAIGSEHASARRADRRALAEIDDLIDDGVYDAASVLAWEVQRAAPGDAAIWLLLARIDYLRERFAAAMYAARMATRLDPTSSEGWLALATTSVTRARWRTEGLDAALQATALAPSDPRTWTVLSQLHLIGDALYDAAVAAEQAIRVDPTDRGGHLMLAETALSAGELAYAEAAFRRVLELDADDPDGRDGLAEVLAARGVDAEPEAERDDEQLAGRRPRRTAASRGRRTAAAASLLSDGGPGGGRLDAVVGTVSVVLGLAVGVTVPAVGVVRGVVAGTAVALMWIAVRPLRSLSAGGPDDATDDDADSIAADGRAAAEHDVEDAPPAVAGAPVSLARELAAGGDKDEDRGGVEPPALAADERVDAASAARAQGPPAVDELPDTIDELVELSRVGLASADVELAHAAASRLEAVAPGSVEAHRALGAVALVEQDFEQAGLHYRRVLELEPLDQEAHERLALVGDAPTRRRSRFVRRGPWSRR